MSAISGSWQKIAPDEAASTANEALSERDSGSSRQERQAHEALAALERWIEELRDAPQGGMRESVERQVRCPGTQHDHAMQLRC